MLEIDQIIEKIAQLVKNEIGNDYKLFLFGSRTRETYDPKADIDIGILSENPLRARQMNAIKEKIDQIPTLLKIDFVDFGVVSKDFKTVAMENAREINI